MKTVCRFNSSLVLALLFTALLVTACGYHNPNIYSGPGKTIYLTEWKNRTSELGLNSELYRSLTRWFQKSGSITTMQEKEGADLILAGEIISLELPSLSYGEKSRTTEVKVRLKVRYILKEIASKKILLETPGELWTEEYLVTTSNTANRDNERKALEKIIDDLSKKIYQRTVSRLSTL